MLIKCFLPVLTLPAQCVHRDSLILLPYKAPPFRYFLNLVIPICEYNSNTFPKFTIYSSKLIKVLLHCNAENSEKPLFQAFFTLLLVYFSQQNHALNMASNRKYFYIHPLLICFNKCMLTMIGFINTNLTIVWLWSPLNTIFTIF